MKFLFAEGRNLFVLFVVEHATARQQGDFGTTAP
jgi:hypothetical protein